MTAKVIRDRSLRFGCDSFAFTAQVLGDKQAAKRVADAIELVALALVGGHNGISVLHADQDAVVLPGWWVESFGQ